MKKCRACGVDVPSNAPFGHCPKCLLELGFGAMPDDAVEPADSCTLRTPSSALTEAPGDYIDRYKLLQKIGEGGCGVVYMADQEEPIRRRVALKVIKPGMDTRAVIARFEAERQALGTVEQEKGKFRSFLLGWPQNLLYRRPTVSVHSRIFEKRLFQSVFTSGGNSKKQRSLRANGASRSGTQS